MYCFTRKPVFLIVDSDNSTAFKTRRQSGSLFTLFLHCPLSGMARLCGANTTRPINVSSATISCAPCCFASCSVAWPCDCHRDFQPRALLSTAHPALPDDLLDVDSVQAKVLDLAELFDARDLFCEAADYSRDL
uniref:Integron gene cassette protein n=1 Tax=Macrostomum lignano TaxID=282301 RepID=A0A1I8FC81_9PLAT